MSDNRASNSGSKLDWGDDDDPSDPGEEVPDSSGAQHEPATNGPNHERGKGVERGQWGVPPLWKSSGAQHEPATNGPNHERGKGVGRGKQSVSRKPDSGAQHEPATHGPNHGRKCRFGENCIDTTCSFLHPRQIDCYWSEKCTKECCPYIHPDKKPGKVVLTSGKDSQKGSMVVRGMEVGKVNGERRVAGARQSHLENRRKGIESYLVFLSNMDQTSPLDFTKFVHKTLVNSLMKLGETDSDQIIAAYQRGIRFGIGVDEIESDPEAQREIALTLQSALNSYRLLRYSENWDRKNDFQEYLLILGVINEVLSVTRGK